MKTINLFGQIRIILMMCIAVSNTDAAVNYYNDGTISTSTANTSVYTWNSADVNMTGGTIVSLDEFNSSQINMQAGLVSQGTSLWNQSQLSMTGGKLSQFLEVHDSAVADLHGGRLDGWLYAADTSVIYVYGYGFDYNPLAGTKNGGLLTGSWANGQTFGLNLLDNLQTNTITYQHIILHQIPEPATLLLLGLGGLILKKQSLFKRKEK
jgi:hypothetical protein